jgi:hypothetical protein
MLLADRGSITPSFLVQPFGGFAIKDFLVNQFGAPPDLEWFHHDFVRL